MAAEASTSPDDACCCRDLKFNVKGSRAAIASPVEVTFTEIGAIPPPRMFSDTNAITLSIKSESSEAQRSAPGMDLDEMQVQGKQTECSDSLPDRDSPQVTVIRDDDLVKEPPDASAIPKKSVLKKSRDSAVAGAASFSQNIPPTLGFVLPPPSERYVFSFAPRPPATDAFADSDSDGEDGVNWRDYYGDDEKGEQASVSTTDTQWLHATSRSQERAHRPQGQSGAETCSKASGEGADGEEHPARLDGRGAGGAAGARQ